MPETSPVGRIPLWLWIWAPTILLIGTVALESEVLFGADHTSPPLRALYEYFYGPTTGQHWWLIHMLIRKSCHFLGYGLISAAIFRSWWLTLLPRLSSKLHEKLHRITERMALPALQIKCHVLAISCTVLVAAADEFHQTFLPNRTGSPWDVLIDGTGAASAQLLVWLGMAVWAQTESYSAFSLE